MLRRAIEMDPNFVPALNNLGVVLMELDRYGEAKIVFQKAYALDSGNRTRSAKISSWPSQERRPGL